MNLDIYFTGTGRWRETLKTALGVCYCGPIVGHGNFAPFKSPRKLAGWLFLSIAALVFCALPPARAQNEGVGSEIVASLSGGRVILHFAKDAILFAAVDQPLEQGAPPPRLVDLDGQHVAILLGASEWRSLADPNPIRMDRNFHRVSARDPSGGSYAGDADPDLEMMGVAFLERLRPLVAQLRRKIDFPADKPFFEMVVIGYGPKDYGPEAWTVEYRITQEMLSSRDNFWQTRVLRPRFTQIYPPEKHAPKNLVETAFPADLQEPTLQTLLEGNDPRFEAFRSDPTLSKAINLVIKGQAQKVEPRDAAEFLRSAIPLLYPQQHFFLGKMEEQSGFDWILPPEEPVEKVKRNDKDQPQEAPSLRKRPNN